VATSKCDSDSPAIVLEDNIVAIMFAEVANYANDAGMFDFSRYLLLLFLPRWRCLGVAIYRVEALRVYEK
jgi:hypothetical protein